MTAIATPLMDSLGLGKLSLEDKARLLDELELTFLAARHSAEIPPELAAELDRRGDEHEADPSSSIPWEVVDRGITERLAKCRRT